MLGEDPPVACTFIAEKYIHAPSSLLSRCVCDPSVLHLESWCGGVALPHGGSNRGFLWGFTLLCDSSFFAVTMLPGSLSRAFRGYEIFGHRESR